MPTQPFTPLPRPRYWNVWWLLTILAAAVGVTGLILEGLGVFRDLGRIEDLLRQRLT